MAWAFGAAAVASAVLVALWLRRRTYRRSDDIVYRELNPWWLPVLAGVAVIVAGPFSYQQPTLVRLTYLLALVWGLTLAFIDIEVRRLPDAMVLPAYPVAAALLTACSVVTADWTALLRSAACAGAAAAGFWILAVASPRAEGLGLGDVKLAGVLGALLGWLGWLPAVLGLLTGFVLGGIGALFLLLSRRADRRSHMSFGPAMILGAYLWCLLAGVA